MQKGFLAASSNDKSGNSLYPESGSNELSYSKEQLRKMDENQAQFEANKKLNSMLNNGSEEGPQAPWYAPEYPRRCQYNSPGCNFEPLASSAPYSSDLHKKLMLESNPRWVEIQSASNLSKIPLAYAGLKDSDIDELFVFIQSRHSDTVVSLDLSNNDLNDLGLQKISMFLAAPACAPNLEELIVYGNKFSKELGVDFLIERGLKLLRKNLQVVTETPSYLLGSLADAKQTGN
jgi:hypothetical protein